MERSTSVSEIGTGSGDEAARVLRKRRIRVEVWVVSCILRGGA
jgi:hypothetical protein